MRNIVKAIYFIVFTVLLIVGNSSKSYAADIVTARDFQLIGPNGKMSAQLTTSGEGTPALFFYDKNGKIKLNLGIYADGAPTIVLFDNNNQAAALLRLADVNGRPVLVFKENGQDKIIIGLHSGSVINPGNSVASGSVSYLSLFISAVIGLIAGFIGSKVGNVNKNQF